MPDYFDDERAYGVSFFERLKTDAGHRSVLNGPSPHDVLASIKRNLDQILNTRLGESLSTPDLGLLDFNDAMLSANDLALHIRNGIHDCITEYEPRIKNVGITMSHDEFSPLTLRFSIIASLDLESMHETIQLELVLDSNKKYRII